MNLFEMADSGYTRRFARQRSDETAGMAGLPGLPARDQRTGQDAEALDSAEARQPEAGLLRMRAKTGEAHEVSEREVRDLPCMEFRTTVVVEVYRVCCPDCGIKIEKVPQLPSKAPFSKRFEDAVGQACESAAARQVARRFGLAASTVRAIDLRYLERWAASAAEAGAGADGRG